MLVISMIEHGKELSPELCREDTFRNKKGVPVKCFKLPVRCKPATGDHGVDMRMEQKFLGPGMEYLYNARDSPEVLWVCSQLQNRLSDTLMEHGEQPFSVGKEQGVEFVGAGKNRMIIRGVDHLAAALIYPEFLAQAAADRTVPVSAGVVVDPFQAAFCADIHVKSAGNGTAFADIGDQFLLLWGKDDAFIIQKLSGSQLKNLLDLRTTSGGFR